MSDFGTRQTHDVTAGVVQMMFDMAQSPILDDIYRNLAELAHRGAKLPRIDGLPARQGQATKIGNAIADVVQEVGEAKITEKDTSTATGYP